MPRCGSNIAKQARGRSRISVSDRFSNSEDQLKRMGNMGEHQGARRVVGFPEFNWIELAYQDSAVGLQHGIGRRMATRISAISGAGGVLKAVGAEFSDFRRRSGQRVEPERPKSPRKKSRRKVDEFKKKTCRPPVCAPVRS